MADEEASLKGAGRKSPLLWVNTTYFAEGLPYMIVRILSTVYFTDIGAKERYLGYLNFLGIPWNLKFLWAPALDLTSSKKRWQVAMQMAVGLAILAISLVNFVCLPAANPAPMLRLVAILLVVTAFLAATNDIAIDAYYLAGLPERRDQAAYSGYRIMAYRGAMIFVRTGLVALVALMASRQLVHNIYSPWGFAFGSGALAMLALALWHGLALPRFEGAPCEKKKSAREFWRQYGQAFATYLKQEKALLVLLFIMLYKVGDELLFAMFTPFLMRELGVSKAQYAWIAGIMGTVGMVCGAMISAYWIKRRGLKKAIWPITLFMNLNIWVYIWLSWTKPNPARFSGLLTIALVHGYEMLANGLGSNALMIYLLGTCRPDFKAAHYAIGSAFMTVFFTLFGGFTGLIVEKIGYFHFFILAFIATIPSVILLFFIPLPEEKK